MWCVENPGHLQCPHWRGSRHRDGSNENKEQRCLPELLYSSHVTLTATQCRGHPCLQGEEAEAQSSKVSCSRLLEEVPVSGILGASGLGNILGIFAALSVSWKEMCPTGMESLSEDQGCDLPRGQVRSGPCNLGLPLHPLSPVWVVKRCRSGAVVVFRAVLTCLGPNSVSAGLAQRKGVF